MGVAIGLLLTVMVIAVIAWPLFRSKSGSAGMQDSLLEAVRLRRARAEIYGQIRELEMDQRAGLIADEEYRSHLRELRVTAARLLRAEEQGADTRSRREQLEREIEEFRSRSRGSKGASG